MSTYKLAADVLRWARANDWRPLHPRNRRDGLYSWTNAVRDPGNRQQSTLRVSVDVSGRVEVQQRMTGGWVAIGWFRVGAGRAVVDILAAMCVLPKEFSTEYRAGRNAAARDIRAVRDTRAADACCKGTGECGIGDCRMDSAVDSALSDAADIAEKGATR